MNLSTIAHHLDISIALADYHLYYLEKNNLLSIIREGGYKRCYIRGEIGAREKKILSLIQQEIPLKIVLFFLKKHQARPKEIRERLDISPALLTYYLRKLLNYEIIEKKPEDERKIFILQNEEQINNLLIRYRPNILLSRFKQTWIDEFPLNKKRLNPESQGEGEEG
jgi:predicted transcriptional regulator